MILLQDSEGREQTARTLVKIILYKHSKYSSVGYYCSPIVAPNRTFYLLHSQLDSELSVKLLTDVC